MHQETSNKFSNRSALFIYHLKCLVSHKQVSLIISSHLIRRQDCNPLVIGALTGLVAPVLVLIYAIKRRSWLLGIIPLCISGRVFALVSDDLENAQRKLAKYRLQLTSGAFATGTALVLKKEAMIDTKDD